MSEPRTAEGAGPLPWADVNAANVLNWAPQLGERNRQIVTAYALEHIGDVVPQVLAGDVEPAAKLEYPLTPQTIKERCGLIAVQRSVALMVPESVEALDYLYPRGQRPVNGMQTLMQKLGIRYEAAQALRRDADGQLKEGIAQAVDGVVDYDGWQHSAEARKVPKNVLVYLSHFEVPIPLLGSLVDVEGMATGHFEQASGNLSEKSRRLIRVLYGIGSGGVGIAFDVSQARWLGFDKLDEARTAVAETLAQMRKTIQLGSLGQGAAEA